MVDIDALRIVDLIGAAVTDQYRLIGRFIGGQYGKNLELFAAGAKFADGTAASL